MMATDLVATVEALGQPWPKAAFLQPLAWGGWILVAEYADRAIGCQVSGHPKVDGLRAEGLDAPDLDIDVASELLARAVAEGSTWNGPARWHGLKKSDDSTPELPLI